MFFWVYRGLNQNTLWQSNMAVEKSFNIECLMRGTLPRLITGWYLVIFACLLGRTVILIGVNQLESWWCNVPLVVSMATINSHRVVFSHGDLLGSKKKNGFLCVSCVGLRQRFKYERVKRSWIVYVKELLFCVRLHAQKKGGAHRDRQTDRQTEDRQTDRQTDR